MSDLLLDEAEVIDLSGGYKRPAEQLRELKLRGFHRAIRSALSGRIVLERAHVVAVASGHQPVPAGGVVSAAPKWRKAA